MVEEFITGQEIDVDILIQDNNIVFMSVTDNFPPKEPYFYEIGCVTPTMALSEKQKCLVEKLVRIWIKRLGFQNACLHFEAICMADTDETIDENYFLMPIEINARLGGSEAWSMVNAAYGVDLLREHVNISLGMRVSSDLKYKNENPQYQCISHDFRENNAVYLKTVKIDVKELKINSNAVEVTITKSRGDLVEQAIMGWVTVKNNLNCTFEDLERCLDRVLANVKFEF